MTVHDVIKMQRVIGAGELMKSANEYTASLEKDFISVAREEYESIKNFEISNETDRLWEEYQNSLNRDLPEKDDIITDKAKDESEWEKLIAMQAKKRKMLEEMLIKRRLFELERISTGNGTFGEKSLPYLEGVSAAELLSIIM